jgi:hypothetical protein
MKNNGSIKWPNLDVWCVNEWVIQEHHPKYTIFVPVRDGDDPATTKPFHYAQNITGATQGFTDSVQRDLFDTTDLQSRTC